MIMKVTDDYNQLEDKEYFISRMIYTSTDVFAVCRHRNAYYFYRFLDGFTQPKETDFIYSVGCPGFHKGDKQKRFIIDCNNTEKQMLRLMENDWVLFTYFKYGSDRNFYIKDVLFDFFGAILQ